METFLISAILSSASVHDSQVSISLAQMSDKRITRSLYDLMDAAYEATEMRIISRKFGHIPIIDDNPRRGVKKARNSSQTVFYCERTSVERFLSYLEN